jgi:hypothetical protein
MGFWTFCKELKESRDSLRKNRWSVGGVKEGEGVFAKPPSPSSPSVQNRGGDWGRSERPAAAIAGALGHGKGRRVGGNGEEAEEVRFPPSPWVGAARESGPTSSGGL